MKVSDSHLFYGRKAQPGVLYRPDYSEATAGDCPTTTVAVLVDGKRTGAKLYVCTNKKCRTHAVHSVGLTPQEKAERKKQATAIRVQKEYRKRLLAEVYERVPAELSRHQLDLVARRLFDQLGHDSQHRIFKFFAWEAKKPNGNSGGYADYPKLAEAKLGAMTAAELGRFLIVCALASDLYCPSYSSGAALPKDSKLAREAAHYKVKAESILQEVSERFTKKSSKQDGQSQPQNSHKRNRKGRGG